MKETEKNEEKEINSTIQELRECINRIKLITE